MIKIESPEQTSGTSNANCGLSKVFTQIILKDIGNIYKNQINNLIPYLRFLLEGIGSMFGCIIVLLINIVKDNHIGETVKTQWKNLNSKFNTKED